MCIESVFLRVIKDSFSWAEFLISIHDIAVINFFCGIVILAGRILFCCGLLHFEKDILVAFMLLLWFFGCLLRRNILEHFRLERLQLSLAELRFIDEYRFKSSLPFLEKILVCINIILVKEIHELLLGIFINLSTVLQLLLKKTFEILHLYLLCVCFFAVIAAFMCNLS